MASACLLWQIIFIWSCIIMSGKYGNWSARDILLVCFQPTSQLEIELSVLTISSTITKLGMITVYVAETLKVSTDGVIFPPLQWAPKNEIKTLSIWVSVFKNHQVRLKTNLEDVKTKITFYTSGILGINFYISKPQQTKSKG